MAHLVRQKKTFYVDAAGSRVPKGSKGAKKVTEASRKWYGAGIPGLGKRRVPLAADKRVAQKMLQDLVDKAERGAAGMVPTAGNAVPLEPLLEQFGKAVRRKASAKHTRDVLRDARRVLDGCKLRTLADLNAPDLAVTVEEFVAGLLPAMSAPNAAYIGKHARQFTRWLWLKKKALSSDPLAAVDLPSQETANRRRALTEDELARLLRTAEASPKGFRDLTGPDRAALYAVAVTTGYRVEELAALTAANVDIDGEHPTVSLSGAFTKNEKDAVQPLAPGAAARLRPILAARPSGPLWPDTWHARAARMVRRDLAAAGVPTAGAKIDFHCLRHTFTTMLGRNAPLKVVQDLARHSTPILTVGRYSHAEADEKAAAVAAIPLGGEAPAALTRPQLEALSAVLLALFGQLLDGPAPDTSPVTPEVETGGDGTIPPGTEAARKGRKAKRRNR